MNLKYFYTLLLILTGWHLIGQIAEVSIGASYSQQTYYQLEDCSTTSIVHEDWDIAFNVNPQSAAIFVNEGVRSSFGAPAPEIALFYSFDEDFSTADTNNIIAQVLNPEISWETGAFNSMAEAGNPFDLGWGTYSSANNTVNSNYIFFIRLRNEQWRKLEIQSLAGGIYTFRHANLDGTDEVTTEVAKSDFAGKTLAYYAFTKNEVKDLEPTHWDLLFTRYYTPLDDGEGNLLEYQVTGVLTNQNTTVVQADDIDPTSASYLDYLEEFQDTLNAIGHDWKFFDFQTGWGIQSDQAFFIKTAADSIWKVHFLDFSGSSLGITTLEKSYEGLLVNSEDLPAETAQFLVFPNPTTGPIHLHWKRKDAHDQKGQLSIINVTGQVVYHTALDVHTGFNTYQLAPILPAGTYWLNLQTDRQSINQQLIISGN